MKRGFQAPDDSDLKPLQQECINSTTAAAADESSSSTTIDTALFKKRGFSDPKRLPVSKYHDDILYLLTQKPSLILSGETGSGKSTLVPIICLKTFKRILVIEPRRLACITLSKRVGQNQQPGLVGHGVRFDHNFDCNSRIVFVTDGVFLNMLMSDPLLKDWDLVIVDECHERTISLDICVGLLKKVVTKRNGDWKNEKSGENERKNPNFRENSRKSRFDTKEPEFSLNLIIMSATFDISNFVSFFGEENSAILCIDGREHTVETFYLSQACPDYIKAAQQTVVDIHNQKLPGDILIFLTSSIEIEQLIKSMRDSELDKKLELFICPLYATLQCVRKIWSTCRNLVVFEVFVVKFSAENSIFQNCLSGPKIPARSFGTKIGFFYFNVKGIL